MMMGAQERPGLGRHQTDERNLTVRDVIAALQREHVELPAGRLETLGREMNVRVLGEAIDLETLRRIVVREVSGSPIYLSDVALVEDGFEDVRRIARMNGVQGQGVGLKKQRGANAVSVARKARAAITEFQKTLPEGMTVQITMDSTKFIEDSVREIQFELILSLRQRSYVGCPGSLSSANHFIWLSLMGTMVIYFLGLTLNTFTLLGMALAVGIVVDDAIMVMENIFRHREGGKGLVKAALEGTHEIAFAALAATLAVVSVPRPRRFREPPSYGR
jgi:multidrug efflux pump subunit AcrB